MIIREKKKQNNQFPSNRTYKDYFEKQKTDIERIINN